METHTPYEERRKHPCDFIVKYKIYSPEDGGRKTGVYQGYRSDFLYEGDRLEDGLWGIHPEFLNERGEEITEKSHPVPQTGFAKMWILSDDFFECHKRRMHIGTKGYFMEGGTKVAECEVIELVRLK